MPVPSPVFARPAAVLALVALCVPAPGTDAVTSVPGHAAMVPVARAPALAPTRVTVRDVRVGAVRYRLVCAGTGRPTALVAPGRAATHTMWSAVLPALGSTTRTCVVDRPGMVRGNPPREVTGARHADEMLAAAAAAGERGPYLLVGHSYAGVVLEAAIRRHPAAVVGALFVDAAGPADARGHWHDGTDVVDMDATARQITPLALGHRPVVVLTAAGEATREWMRRQGLIAAASTDSTWVVVARTGHKIMVDRPAAVVAALRVLVAAERSGRRLDPCGLLGYGTQPRCRRT